MDETFQSWERVRPPVQKMLKNKNQSVKSCVWNFFMAMFKDLIVCASAQTKVDTELWLSILSLALKKKMTKSTIKLFFFFFSFFYSPFTGTNTVCACVLAGCVTYSKQAASQRSLIRKQIGKKNKKLIVYRVFSPLHLFKVRLVVHIVVDNQLCFQKKM